MSDFKLCSGLNVRRSAVFVEILGNDPLIIEDADPSLTTHVCEENGSLSIDRGARRQSIIVYDHCREDLVLIQRCQAEFSPLIGAKPTEVFRDGESRGHSHFNHAVCGDYTGHISEDLVIELFTMCSDIEIGMKVQITTCDTRDGLYGGHIKADVLERESEEKIDGDAF